MTAHNRPSRRLGQDRVIGPSDLGIVLAWAVLALPAAAFAAPTRTATPSPEGTSPSAKDGSPSAEEKDAPRERGAVGTSKFEIEVGAAASGRHFYYNDAITSTLRSYDSFPAALATAHVEVYPLADTTTFFRDVGVVGTYARSLLLTSTASTGGVTETIQTSETSYFVGLRLRVHPSGDPKLILGISEGASSRSVAFDASKVGLDAQVPAVDCIADRVAVDFRLPLGPLAVRGEVGYRFVFDGGEVANRFRGASIGGVDAELGVAWPLVQGWEVRALGDYERYFYSFKPTPGDAYVAGGALDEFYGGRIALAFIF